MKLIKLWLAALLLSLTLGQVARLPVSPIYGAVNLIDIILVITVGSWLFSLKFSKRKILLPPGFWPLAIFWFVAGISLVNAFKFFPTEDVLVSGLFLIRFFLYSQIYLVVYNTVTCEELPLWTTLLILVGAVIASLGLLQFIFLPDLRFLALYGWDPHVGRLVSTFLDPNFVGGFLVLTLILLLSKILFAPRAGKFELFLVFLLLVSILLTFSRSTYLMLTVSLLSIGILKSKKLLFGLLLLFFLAIVLVPRVNERVIGALNVDVTAQARIDSWKNALTIASDFPFWGVGFNTFRFAQVEYGYFNPDQPQGSHAGAGSDSSFLTILATTGTFGLVVYLFIYLRIIGKSWLTAGSNYLSFSAVVSLVSLFFHSQFVNSLLFPPTMLWLWFTIGLAFVATRHDK